MMYEVLIDDNFHFMDESYRIKRGMFSTLAAAVDACKRIVNESLESAFEAGMSASYLFQQYQNFGEDPFIIPRGTREEISAVTVEFSAWDYAEQRSKEMAAAAGEKS